MELTQEQRIDIIRELHNKVRGLPVNDEVLNFVENFKAEEAMEEQAPPAAPGPQPRDDRLFGADDLEGPHVFN